MNNKIKIITFSGVDGAGKTTILTKVKELIEDKYKKEVVVLRHRPSILPILSAIKHGKKKLKRKQWKYYQEQVKINPNYLLLLDFHII